MSQLFNCYKFAMFTECMFIVIEMFTCFYGVWFYVFPAMIQPDIKLFFRLFNILNLAHDAFQYVDDIGTMGSDLVKNCKGLSGLSACKCCCFENLLAAK